MGRRPNDKKVLTEPFSIKLRIETFDKLEKEAKRLNRSRSNLIDTILSEKLNEHP